MWVSLKFVLLFLGRKFLFFFRVHFTNFKFFLGFGLRGRYYCRRYLRGIVILIRFLELDFDNLFHLYYNKLYI